GMGAFVGNTPLETIDLPASVNYFEGSAVSDCINLKSINVASGNTNYSSYDGCLYDKAQTTLIRVPEGYGGWDNSGFYGDTRYKSYPEGIPTTLKTIGDYALQNLQNITKIFIPYGVTTIENSAFEYCIKLIYIHIPSSVSSFDTDYAFKGCSALDVINIGKCNPNDAPFTVDASTFEGVPSSCKIRLPIDGVAACKKADYWKNFTITGGGFDFTLWEYDGAVTNKIYYPYRVDDGKLYLCKEIVYSDIDNALYNKLIDYVIPSSATYNGKTYRVVGLDQQCCKGNEHIQKVIMPSTITELKGICDANYVDDLDEGQQFYGCSSLHHIEFSPNIKKIPNSFAEGAHLSWLYLPYGVEDIGHSAFANNTAIQSILIPSSVTHMWANAIYGCSSLKWISTNVEPNVATEAAGTTACGFEGIPKTCRVYVPLGLADKYRNSKISDSQMHWNYFNPDSIKEGAYDIAGNGIAITVTKASTATTMGEGRVVYRPNYTLTTAELGSVIKDYFGRSYRITALSDSCFAGTSTLSEVTFDSTWNGKLTTIPRHAFQRTNALKTFPWADSHMSDLKTIESGAFVEGYLEGEHDLSCLTKLTTIEDKAFFNNLIETMKLPSSLTYIGSKGMGDMVKLKTLVCDNPTPANLGSDVWYNV
ncbi:MAG: leucine-rich repeat protein, partial [Muribaculaceae bacterium]|nr:leucine-rich repeat protein [Muribaculaceae bacterium]